MQSGTFARCRSNVLRFSNSKTGGKYLKVSPGTCQPRNSFSSRIRRVETCDRRRQTALVLKASAPNPEMQSTAKKQVSRPDGKIGVLFVCLGNICRSPTAEAMFNAVVKKAGVKDRFDIDSCGTGGGNPGWYYEDGWSYHEGEPSDPRMTATAKGRGVILTSQSRPLKPVDMTKFDYIIGMDTKNNADIQVAADYWAGKHNIPDRYRDKVSLMMSYCNKFEGQLEVPDPYYGGNEGFEKVLDLLDDACEGLLSVIREEYGF